MALFSLQEILEEEYTLYFKKACFKQKIIEEHPNFSPSY